MKPLINRSAALLAAGLLAAGTDAFSKTTEAQASDIRGTLTFAGDTEIPKGQIKIYIEDTAIKDSTRELTTQTHLNSLGKSKAIDFSVARPSNVQASPTLRIIAQLQRPDGWLLAQGSIKVNSGKPLGIMLYRTMY
ncbi:MULTISPECIES: hypothetical protein [unclassified Pseudovibrio]|uniref:hypothetical protein n=1 Tax=unclassified Pseudovibrio TaxID=2627060 RepID=UPI0007AE98C4|nr:MULTISPECIES: hypothetical protein [unclassified Pseudovibrio]KZL01271.1 hypothetical protein PsW74_02069 [Pseudovibrio sp. W74]KZL11336.1 hypothetical protein PsAD14_01090 [Pseudovibrio sp. Ad14]